MTSIVPGEKAIHRALLAMARRLEQSSIRHLFPRWLKRQWWGLVTRGHIHDVYGSRMYLPPDQRGRELILDRYEPAVTKKLVELLRPGMTFFDVGANIGVFSLLASKIVGSSGRVIAFEPIPENADVLRRNIHLNRYDNIVVHEKCVAASDRTVQLYLSSFRGSHSLLPRPARATGEKYEVEAVRLDSLPECKSIDLMKVDVEGAEIQVLQSLGIYRPQKLILEYNAEREAAAGFPLDKFIEVLSGLGYTSIENLDAPGVRLEDSREGNLLCSLLGDTSIDECPIAQDKYRNRP